VLRGRSAAGKECCGALEVSEATLDRWRKQYGGMKSEEAVRLKHLEDENKRLKKVVAKLPPLNRNTDPKTGGLHRTSDSEFDRPTPPYSNAVNTFSRVGSGGKMRLRFM
jgi:hypothetical protein